MNLGELYTFKYTAKKKPYDRKPHIIFLGETSDYIFGINLNFVPKSLMGQLVKHINNELLRAGVFDEENIERVMETKKQIENEEFFNLLLIANETSTQNAVKQVDKRKIKSRTGYVKIMKETFRIYSKERIEGKIKESRINK